MKEEFRQTSYTHGYFLNFNGNSSKAENTVWCLLTWKLCDAKMMQCMRQTWYLHNRAVLVRTWCSAKELFYAYPTGYWLERTLKIELAYIN